MRYLKTYGQFLKESVMTAPEKTEVDVPVKPVMPTKPVKPIIKPAVDPAPKADESEENEEVTELDVAKRFISEIEIEGDDIKKYIK